VTVLLGTLKETKWRGKTATATERWKDRVGRSSGTDRTRQERYKLKSLRDNSSHKMCNWISAASLYAYFLDFHTYFIIIM
jgi:hypothetical protein